MLLNRYSSLLMSLLIILLMCISSQVNAQTANRVALIMTNSAYDTKLGALANPHRDAELMQSTLTQLGFKVTALRDGTLQQMKYAVADFTTTATGADLAFIYYSGHGAQADGASYLIPIGAKLNSPTHYELETLPLENLLKSLSRARPRNAVVVLDACRDNPLAFTKSTGDKGLGRLPDFDRILIAQAAPQGRTTPDNGLYAKVLSQTLLKPNLTLVNAFLETNASIRKQTSEAQVPRISEVTIDHEIVLKPSVVAVTNASNSSNLMVMVTPELKYTQHIPATYKTVTEQLEVSPQSKRYEVIPATYTTVTAQELVAPEMKRQVVVPGTYKTITERVLVSPEYKRSVIVPAQYEFVSEQIIVKAAGFREEYTQPELMQARRLAGDNSSNPIRKIEIPAEYGVVTFTRLSTPSSNREVTVPAEYKTVTKEVVDRPPSIREELIPAVYKTVARQVVDVPPSIREIIVPAVYKTVERRVIDKEGTTNIAVTPATYKAVPQVK